MDNLKYLLKELTIINQRIIDREKTQDSFNVFDLMFKRSDEVKLHSRFLSVLMDPTASHKMGDLFLRLFIERLGIDFRYDLSSLQTFPNGNNASEHLKIDLLLIDRKYKSAIIIENKIWAKDSNHENEGQLERYYRRINQEEGIPKDSISVIYLSVDRDTPSEESVCKSGLFPELKDKIINIYYGSEILDWLKLCIKECYNKPSLRETILQYIKLVEIMTNNDTSEEDIKSIITLVGKDSDNLLSAKLLIDNSCHLYWWAVYLFWKELAEAFVLRGYKIRKRIENKEIDDLVHGGPQKRKVSFNMGVISPSGIEVTIAADYRDSMCIGMTDDTSADLIAKAQAFFKENEQRLSLKSSGSRIFYQSVDLGNLYGLVLSDFTNDTTFSLLSETERTKIVGLIVEQADGLIGQFLDFNQESIG